MSNTGTQLVKFGALALVIQNLIFLLGGFVAPDLVNYVLYIDLLGFGLLGIGYILHTQQGGADQRFLIGGGAIIAFLLARIMWQFILTDSLVAQAEGGSPDVGNFVNTIENMIYAFFISSIALLVAGYFINKVSGSGGTIFLSYTIINFIAVFLIVQPFIATNAENIDSQAAGLVVGFFVKILVVPILGIIAFAKIFSNTDDHLGMASPA